MSDLDAVLGAGDAWVVLPAGSFLLIDGDIGPEVVALRGHHHGEVMTSTGDVVDLDDDTRLHVGNRKPA